MDPIEAHARAHDVFTSALANVTADQLELPTPCTDWNVRELVVHVINGSERMIERPPSEPRDLDELVAVHAETAAASHAAFAAPDGLERIYRMPYKSYPGSFVIGLMSTGALVHAWDVARATGQSTDFDPELAEEMLTVIGEAMLPEYRGEGRPFAAERECPPGATAADRLAAFLGRDVG